jgi:hypothetical protein
MRKHNQKDIDSLVNKILSETLEEKANSLVSRLNKEVNEDGMGGPKSTNPKNGERKLGLDMSKEEIDDIINDMRNGRYDDDDNISVDVDDNDDMSDIFDYDDDIDDDEYEELDENDSDICECGGNLYEGTCNECGNSYGMMDEEEDFDDSDEVNPENYNEGRCQVVQDVIDSQGGEITPLDREQIKLHGCKSLNESLKNKKNDAKVGNRKVLDKNKNNKIDSEDFKLLRGKKTETKESLKGGQKNLDKNKNNKIDAEDFKLMNKDKKTNKKESVKLSEAELVDLIESIVKEDMKGMKTRGMSEYEKAHKGSGKENEDYIKSVTKKMSDYLKDGSKGKYEMNPKKFPKGNGEMGEMKTKKYSMSKDGEKFIDDYLRPSNLNLEYDNIEPNEEWMKGNLEGSSKTGNNPKWANAEETELGEKLNKRRKENKFAKLRRQAYNKAPQPVTDKTGEESGKGINIKLESTEKQTKVLNEEFTKIQHLMGYSRKTQ